MVPMSHYYDMLQYMVYVSGECVTDCIGQEGCEHAVSCMLMFRVFVSVCARRVVRISVGVTVGEEIDRLDP